MQLTVATTAPPTAPASNINNMNSTATRPFCSTQWFLPGQTIYILQNTCTNPFDVTFYIRKLATDPHPLIAYAENPNRCPTWVIYRIIINISAFSGFLPLFRFLALYLHAILYHFKYNIVALVSMFVGVSVLVFISLFVGKRAK